MIALWLQEVEAVLKFSSPVISLEGTSFTLFKGENQVKDLDVEANQGD